MVCLVGVIVVKSIAIYSDKVRVPPKKQIASKPKNFNKTYKSVEPQELIKDEYTFFNTLHDPSMQKFVGLEGIVVKKNEVTGDELMTLDIKKANSLDVKLNDPIVKHNIQHINNSIFIYISMRISLTPLVDDDKQINDINRTVLVDVRWIENNCINSTREATYCSVATTSD